ncbi:MAG: hypothetical protein RIR70_509 [Pseudomonadota bacterium]|jgi:hypothetical protein
MFQKVPPLGPLPKAGCVSDKTLVNTQSYEGAHDVLSGAPESATGEAALKAMMAIRENLKQVETDPQAAPEILQRVSIEGVRQAETLHRTLSKELIALQQEERKLSPPSYLSPRAVLLSSDAEGVCPSFKVRTSEADDNVLVRQSALSQAEFRVMQSRRVLDEIRDLAGEPPNNLQDLLL